MKRGEYPGTNQYVFELKLGINPPSPAVASWTRQPSAGLPAR
jgi:hypothetical protein